jgi:hypothetical protein
MYFIRFFLKKAGQLLKWLLLGLFCLEIGSFLIVTLSNYIIFGKIREGSRVLYDPYALYLNVEGVRPTANNTSRADPPNVLWLLGGSTMRGATDDDARTIPSYLAGILNRAKPDSYLVNFGENSFNSLLETKYLQKLLIERKPWPTRIIFYDGANDCTYFAQYRTPGAHLGYRRVRALIESYHQSLPGLFKPLNAAWNASFSREVFEKFRGVAEPLKADSPLVREFVDSCEKRYDHIDKIARGYGAEFLLFWQPLWWVETAAVSPTVREQENLSFILKNQRFAAFRDNIALINEALVTRLKNKPYFIDFRNILGSRSEPVYQADGVHLLDVGRKMVAQEMAQVLEQRRSRP